MRLGLTIVGDTVAHFIHHVQQADRAGVAAIGTGDSQTLYGEVWILCALAGTYTSPVPWSVPR